MFFLFTPPREDRGTVCGGPADIPLMLHGGGGRVMLAFETEALAEAFRVGTDMAAGAVVSLFDLPSRDPLWRERPDHVLLFPDEEVIRAYREERDTFPFDRYIFRLEKDALLG
jgi:hypothetical protein